MRHAELFAGYGGLSLAVDAAFGAELAWYAEFDPAPSRIMARHWPDVPNHHDVTQINWSQVEPVDIISGGSPCQDVSAAGRRAGMNEGTRSNLWVAMREAIATIKPTYVVWENVRGAHSAKAHSEVESEPGLLGDTRDTYLRATGRVLGDLAGLGYDAEWRTVTASAVGAPHRRERVFVLAWRRGSAVAHSLGGRDGGRHGSPGTGEGAWQADQAGGPVGSPGGTGPVESLKLLPTVLANEHDGNASEGNLDRKTVPLKAVVHLLPTPRASHSDHGGPNQRDSAGHYDLPAIGKLLPTVDTVTLLPTLGARDHKGKNGGVGEGFSADINHAVETLLPTVTTSDTNGPGAHGDGGADLRTTVATADFGIYTPAITRWEQVLGRPAPPPTELSPRGRHRLSEHFTEWMMGLPEGWICDAPGITRRDAIKAAGNGVVPQQAAAALTDMLNALKAHHDHRR